MEIRRKIKRAITLLEVMIVVLLIGIIGSVLGYNMKGSLDEGKAFKSREGARQVRDILLMQVQDEDKLKKLVENNNLKEIGEVLLDSGLVADPQKLLVDGWDVPYTFKVVDDNGVFDLKVSSNKLEAHEAKKKKI